MIGKWSLLIVVRWIILFLVWSKVQLSAQSFHTVPAPMGVVNAFIADSNGTIYLASETRGVYSSIDHGTSWKKMGGNTIGVGEIDAFCFSDKGELVAATQQGGIKYWNGTSWISINSGLPQSGSSYPSFKTIVNDKSDHLLAGAYGSFAQIGGAYIYDGVSWKSISAGLPDSNIYCMTLSPDGYVYAGTDGSGVFRYDGTTWSPVNVGLGNLHVNYLTFSEDGSLFAGTKTGVYSLSVGSINWIKKGSSFNSAVLSIAFNPTSPGRIIIGLGSQLVDRGSLYGSMKISDDNGDNWSDVNFDPATLRVSSIIVLKDGTILSGAQGIFRSVDHGDNWSASNTGFDAKINNYLGSGLAFNSKDDIYFGSNYGVFKSTDEGQSWNIVNTGITLPLISLLAVDSFDNVFTGNLALRKGYTLPQANLYRSINGGLSWDTVEISNDDSYTSFAIAPNGDYFCTHGFGANPPSATIIGSSVAISKDHGLSWQDLNVPDAGKGFSIAINSKGHIYYGAELNGVYRSTDGGQSWMKNIDPAIYGNIAPMAISPSDDIFTCGYGLHHIYYSDSSTAGMPFTNMVSPDFPSYTGASSFIFDDYGKLYTGTQGGNKSGLFTSTPPWSADTKFIPNASVGPVRVVTMRWDHKGYLWLLSNGFLLKSDSILKFDPLLTQVKHVPSKNEPDLSVYPNPFGNQAIFEFSLVKSGLTSVMLYDQYGRALKTLISRELSAGIYRYDVNGNELLSGIYYLELVQGGMRRTIRLIHF